MAGPGEFCDYYLWKFTFKIMLTNKCSKLYQKSRRYSIRHTDCHVSWDTLYVSNESERSCPQHCILSSATLHSQSLPLKFHALWVVKHIYTNCTYNVGIKIYHEFVPCIIDFNLNSHIKKYQKVLLHSIHSAIKVLF